MTELRHVAPGVHVADAPQRFFGIEIGTRMTVLALADGLLVHSPIGLDPARVAQLGDPRWVLAPNKYHHLYVKPWADAGLDVWGVQGLPKKRPDISFAGVVDPGTSPFGAEVELLPLTCFPLTNEVVMLHRPGRTLVVSDLVFNTPPTAPLMTRCALRALLGYPGCRATLFERVGMRRKAARREVASILDWDFDRIVMAHGDVIETGGKSALAQAYAWLLGTE